MSRREHRSVEHITCREHPFPLAVLGCIIYNKPVIVSTVPSSVTLSGQLLGLRRGLWETHICSQVRQKCK